MLHCFCATSIALHPAAVMVYAFVTHCDYILDTND